MKRIALSALLVLCVSAAYGQPAKQPAPKQEPAKEAAAKPAPKQEPAKEAAKPAPKESAAKQTPAKPTLASAEDRKSRRSADARHCLEKSSNTEIIKCAEAYL